MVYKDIVKALNRDGWQLARTKGSHCQFKHPCKKGCITVPQHGNKDISLKVVENIERATGLSLRR